MTLRTRRDRALQTLCYEAGGLLLATPLYAAIFGGSLEESALLMVALSVMVLTWAPIFNTLADWVEFRLCGRLASDRPHGWRILHALSLELTSVLLTVPVLMWMGGFGLWEAIAVDIGLTMFYAVYAYGFHLVYDRLRPIARPDRRMPRQP